MRTTRTLGIQVYKEDLHWTQMSINITYLALPGCNELWARVQDLLLSWHVGSPRGPGSPLVHLTAAPCPRRVKSMLRARHCCHWRSCGSSFRDPNSLMNPEVGGGIRPPIFQHKGPTGSYHKHFLRVPQ